MKLWNRLKIAANQSSWDKMISSFLSGGDFHPSGQIDVSGNNALKFNAVFACIRVLAETYACVPISEFRRRDDGDRDGGGGGRDKTDETGLYDILHNVYNDEMSAYNAKEMSMYQINLGGNAVFEKQVNRFGEITGLYPYQHQNVKIDRDENKRLRYQINDGCGLNAGEIRTLYRPEVLHIPGPSLDGICGLSPIQYAAQAIRLGLTYEQFGVNFYKNGAVPSGVFECPTGLSDEAYKRLKENLKEHYTGLLNTGKPMLLEDGLKYNQLTMKLSDAELLASKGFQVEDICRVFRVQQHLVQKLDKATNNNIEHQGLEFVIYTMLPIFKRAEDCINTQLLTKAQRRAGYYFEHNMAALLRGDQKSMAEAFATGRQWGWLSVNDIKRLLNQNPIPNGNIYLQPMNMIEAGTQAIEDQNKNLVDQIYQLIESRG